MTEATIQDAADDEVEFLSIDEAELDETRPPELSDDALAVEVSRQHGLELRYVAAWGKWLIWNGKIWRTDDTLRVFGLVRIACRRSAAALVTAEAKPAALRIAAAVASAKTVAAVEKLAKSDRLIAATIDQWDADPWLLNTPRGVIDLRTGKIADHRREDFITKCTAVAARGKCPVWLAFLDRVTAGDKELQAFLRRVVGYALTGITREHAIFFVYGTGGNGKGTFLNTITGILSGYATTASVETFTASSGERHPTDLAMLRGARLVSAQETEEGRRWAESKIKSLTGGDPITARFMRQDFFTFLPQFKLIIAGNHKPGLRSVDEAIRRRFHLIPFTQTIDEEERDVRLPEKLKAEWPGILQWMVQGCLEWQREGLSPPDSVRIATEEYLAAEDAMQGWLDECCTVKASHWSSATDLFASWSAWAHRSGEFVGSRKSFSPKLQERGFAPRRGGHAKTRGFEGISVNPKQLNLPSSEGDGQPEC